MCMSVCMTWKKRYCLSDHIPWDEGLGPQFVTTTDPGGGGGGSGQHGVRNLWGSRGGWGCDFRRLRTATPREVCFLCRFRHLGTACPLFFSSNYYCAPRSRCSRVTPHWPRRRPSVPRSRLCPDRPATTAAATAWPHRPARPRRRYSTTARPTRPRTCSSRVGSFWH